MAAYPSFRAALLGAAFCAASGAALAQTAAPAAAPAAPTLLGPSMSQPLAMNANPYAIDMKDLGTWYVDGVVSGLAYAGSNATQSFHSDNGGSADISNAMAIIQKSSGLVQFYAQVGLYSVPSLGTAYLNASKYTDQTFGPVPVAYVKLQPIDAFSVQAGKLATLIGAETFNTFQNFNIERGLLFNAEPIIGKGVQANYTIGPVAASVQVSDGYYSDHWNFVSGLVTWTIDSSNTLAVDAGGNIGHTDVNTYVTPVVPANSQIYNVMYTYSSGPLTVTPYLQYQHVDKDKNLAGQDFGIMKDASTYGGAILVNYNVDDHWSLGARGEYLQGEGKAGDQDPAFKSNTYLWDNGTTLGDPNGPNLTGYGPGSKAYSFTITPTYKWDKFFVRAEGSYVGLSDAAVGTAFARTLSKDSQFRAMLEAGVLF